MSLKEYRRKRKFDQTPEPAPGDKKSPVKGAACFVVQKHAATRTHYDFRLEMGGSLKSWAVPKGPTLTSGDPRLAVFVEDHPLEYGKFEGIIPKGNYGAGTVMVWDRGTLLERGSNNRKQSEKALLEGLEKGHITFLLSGEKLRGEFALVKIKKKNAPPNGWLLIKKHDAEASRRDILQEDRSVVTGRSMEQIASQSEKKGDIWISHKRHAVKKKTNTPKSKTRSSLEKKSLRTVRPAKKMVSPSGMLHKVRLMEPVFSVHPPENKNWIYEPFRQGIRAIAEVEKSQVKLYSRSFLPFEKKYPSLVSALKNMKCDAVLDGEIVREGKNTFFVVSDLLYFNGKDLRNQALKKRKKILEGVKLTSPLKLVTPVTELAEVSSRMGIAVGKNLDSLYTDGLSREWLRLRVKANRGISSGVSAADKPPVTHPSKIYWPKEEYTKGDLVAYYDSIADIMMPYMVDRPQSLHRQPDGIKTEGFFHKDMQGFLPRRIKTVRVFSASSGKTVNYVLCQDRWSLLYLANLGCIEFNPWLSRQNNLENPDFVVIDLDPDGNPFSEVIKVAKEVHRVLKSVKAESYCKTSGATGLHICIPTQGRFDFDTGRLFAEKVCHIVHQKFPKTTSVLRNPDKRKGRIYLDFLQNRRGQTLAAPYCVRPRPLATVSTPLKWSELKPGLKPEKFTIKTILRRLAKVGDLWKPMLAGAVDIEACMKKLSDR